jgi:hypothetical protein
MTAKTTSASAGGAREATWSGVALSILLFACPGCGQDRPAQEVSANPLEREAESDGAEEAALGDQPGDGSLNTLAPDDPLASEISPKPSDFIVSPRDGETVRGRKVTVSGTTRGTLDDTRHELLICDRRAHVRSDGTFREVVQVGRAGKIALVVQLGDLLTWRLTEEIRTVDIIDDPREDAQVAEVAALIEADSKDAREEGLKRCQEHLDLRLQGPLMSLLRRPGISQLERSAAVHCLGKMRAVDSVAWMIEELSKMGPMTTIRDGQTNLRLAIQNALGDVFSSRTNMLERSLNLDTVTSWYLENRERLRRSLGQ